MDNKVFQYRQKHPKCKYCKYYDYHAFPGGMVHGFWECKAKDKVITFENIPRIFCSCYEVENGKL